MATTTMRGSSSRRFGGVSVDPLARRPIPLGRHDVERELAWTRERLENAKAHDAALGHRAVADGRLPITGASARVGALVAYEARLVEALAQHDGAERVAADQAHRAAEQEAP